MASSSDRPGLPVVLGWGPWTPIQRISRCGRDDAVLLCCGDADVRRTNPPTNSIKSNKSNKSQGPEKFYSERSVEVSRLWTKNDNGREVSLFQGFDCDMPFESNFLSV